VPLDRRRDPHPGDGLEKEILVRLAFPTDEHCPYQDDSARSVALQIVRDFNPNLRIAGSDGLDFYTVSHFDKDPARLKAGGLQDEINVWQACQREWKDASPNAAVFFLVGNHEDRLRRYLWKHPELAGLEVLTLPVLLGFASLGIVWETAKGERANLELALYGKLVVKHGHYVRKHSAYSARAEAEAEAFAVSTISGHTHRGGTHYITHRGGVIQAQESFCLCRLEPEYVEHPNWQQGIVLAMVGPDFVSIEAIPFYRRQSKVQAVWREKHYVEE
jgi:hypothetical protein